MNKLFDDDEQLTCETEWFGMPEFVQEKNVEYQKIIVRFSCEEDVIKFAELIGQKVYPATQSIWFPLAKSDGVKEIGRDNSRRYINES